MKITNCPKCGGRLRAESIGWKCEGCRGFVDMQSTFHEHIDRPFMPPMTIADKIRAMTDDQLADFLYPMTFGIDPAASFCKNKKECGDLLDADKEIPEEWCKKCLQGWLQQPAEGG